jgi:hypothetical protein
VAGICLAVFGCPTTIPGLSSPYCSHYTDYAISGSSDIVNNNNKKKKKKEMRHDHHRQIVVSASETSFFSY